MDVEQVVYIVDDEELVCKSMCKLVESVGYPARAFTSAEDFLANLESVKCGCILIDVCMPGLSGLELQHILNERHIEMPVFVISGHADVPMAVRALKAGAVDFIEKPYKSEELLVKIRDCFQSQLSRQVDSEMLEQASARMATLTRREKDVMKALVDGKRNKDIADDLGLSRRTIEAHRANIMEKLNANTLSDVVRQALQHDANRA